MNKNIEEQLSTIKERFTVKDEDKILWYLEKVGYHRLSFYFKNNTSTEQIISEYIFDKILRHLVLDMLEILENSLKCVVVNEIWEMFQDKFWYMNRNIYKSEVVDGRLAFIYKKIDERKEKDATIKDFFEKNGDWAQIPDSLFFDKLTFGELIKVLRDMYFDYFKKVAQYFGIAPTIFDNRIFSLKYLRNLASHHENIYNKNMVIRLLGDKIQEFCGNRNSFLAYFAVLSVFNKLLIENYKWADKVFEKMEKYNISLEKIWQKENLPSELESEAWEVLVNKVYTKYVKKASFSVLNTDK